MKKYHSYSSDMFVCFYFYFCSHIGWTLLGYFFLAMLNSYWSQRTRLNGPQSPLPHSDPRAVMYFDIRQSEGIAGLVVWYLASGAQGPKINTRLGHSRLGYRIDLGSLQILNLIGSIYWLNWEFRYPDGSFENWATWTSYERATCFPIRMSCPMCLDVATGAD